MCVLYFDHLSSAISQLSPGREHFRSRSPTFHPLARPLPFKFAALVLPRDIVIRLTVLRSLLAAGIAHIGPGPPLAWVIGTPPQDRHWSRPRLDIPLLTSASGPSNMAWPQPTPWSRQVDASGPLLPMAASFRALPSFQLLFLWRPACLATRG